MAEENKEMIALISKWEAYAYNVMPFGLCNVPATYQKVVTKTFNKYLNDFMQVFLDDFSAFSKKEDHIGQLQKCLQECYINGINLNSYKCVFLLIMESC
jgi:hypothetical protein